MNLFTGGMPQSVKEQVLKSTIKVNIIIFIFSVVNGFLFWYYDATTMFYYNILLTVIFIYACVALKKGKIIQYALIVCSGLFFFMILAVIFLGWDFGFQQYCIGFAASFIFTDYYLYRERRLSKRAIITSVVIVTLYMGLRIWTYYQPCVYYVNNIILTRGFYLLNSVLGFSFMIMYLCIYSNTVRRLEYELLDMANIDPLTGLSNRRKMHEILKMVFGVKEKEISATTAIAMFDVDFFKNVNDTYGHDAGDEVLITLAKILDNNHKEKEGFHACRWGGEEFLVLYECEQKSTEEIVKEFDEIRCKVQDTVVIHNGMEINITVTIGLAFYREGMTIQELINEADEKLYQGKQTGRNKVISML